MSDLRNRQSGAPPLTPGSQLQVVLGAVLIIGGIWYFRSMIKLPPELHTAATSVIKSFH